METISARLMGDAAEEGDIAFGGEVSLDAQVSSCPFALPDQHCPRLAQRSHPAYASACFWPSRLRWLGRMAVSPAAACLRSPA